jgi:serine/threonine protein kinase
VYKGKNQETDELVAIKEISWLVIRRRSPEFIARHSQNLRNETDILQSLDHPNIVRLLGQWYSAYSNDLVRIGLI